MYVICIIIVITFSEHSGEAGRVEHSGGGVGLVPQRRALLLIIYIYNRLYHYINLLKLN